MEKLKGQKRFRVRLPAAIYAYLQEVKKQGESYGEAAKRLVMAGVEKTIAERGAAGAIALRG